MIRLRTDSDRLRRTLRRREIEAVFRTVPDDTFEDALELGAGDGAQSQYIARCARKVLCTDLNADRLERASHPTDEDGGRCDRRNRSRHGNELG